MLTHEDNQILTQVGPGTLMGDLLRRYWTPACLSSELVADGSPLDVRLLGEDLVAFRDTNGKVGLLDKNCPHRGASLFYARNEECGLRCIYHGWKFDAEGNCTDMPSELRSFAERVKAPTYPVHESGGIVWTYMGPKETQTPFRNFGTDELPKEEVFASKVFWDCNWVQSMEGNVDTAHISHLHQFFSLKDIPDDGSDKPGYPSTHWSWKLWSIARAPRIEVNDEWYGFRYAGLRQTPNGHTHVRMTAYTIPYGTVIASIPFSTRQLFVVPVDDYSCHRYAFSTGSTPNPSNYGGAAMTDTPYTRGAGGPGGAGGITPRTHTASNKYQIDREFQKHVAFSGIPDFVSQDMAVTESMGAIYDRTKEHLGAADLAIIRMRAMLIDSAKALAEGIEPPGLAGKGDFRTIRSGEKILEEGEDWRVLGTGDDPAVQESLAARRH
jgi:phthalate 4,5-dioxygenase